MTARLELETELLPCPFCGAKATILRHAISCDACLCDVQRATNESDEQLAASWNIRSITK